MDADVRALFEQSLRHAVATSSDLDAALRELGWHEALADDPRLAVSLLFEAQGAANAMSSGLDVVLAAPLDRAGTVVLPSLGRYDAPGEITDAGLSVRGLTGRSAAGDADVVVVARAGGEHVVLVVPSPSLTMRPVAGLDPALGLVEVTGEQVAVPAGSAAVAWSAVVTAGQMAIAHELIGASRSMVALARDHAMQRVQFGRPIASFQAVRHRLADPLVAIEGADAAVAAAWEEPAPLAAVLAKSLAGVAARTVARHAQQVLAGMGFTIEHPLHRYVRRVFVLDQLFGSSQALTRELGEQVLRTRELPAMLPL
jgi:Acyl-CoA dehydrogenase, C-terminal domain